MLIYIFQSGCAIVNLPLKTVEIVGSIAKQALNILQKIPKPPPGVF
jgi:hypothetical protein